MLVGAGAAVHECFWEGHERERKRERESQERERGRVSDDQERVNSLFLIHDA
jgi:hypothetical protein